jgi:transcriptional regulator with XRE-family HTH domain
VYNESLFVVKTENAAFAIVSSEVIQVELTQIGKFIAELRKEHGFTQEQLGDKIGVTNKTISRWETGMYLPPADALLMISELFDVSINEILCGKRLSKEEYKKAAEENLKQTIKASSFSLKEKIDYFKKKWLKEHIALMALWGICIIGVFITGIILSKPLLVSGSVILLVLGHGWRNNTMMTYVEQNAFDGSGRQ